MLAREQVVDHGAADGDAGGAAERLDEATDYQHRHRARDERYRGADREQTEPCQQHPAPADAVGPRAVGEQADREGDAGQADGQAGGGQRGMELGLGRRPRRQVDVQRHAADRRYRGQQYQQRTLAGDAPGGCCRHGSTRGAVRLTARGRRRRRT